MLVVGSPEIFKLALHHIFSFVGNLSFFLFEGILDLALRLGCNDNTQPVFIGLLFGRGDDLDLVTAAQLVAERNQIVVDFGADALYTDSAMDREGKVEGCRSHTQHLYVYLRCIYIYLLGKGTGVEVL